MARVFIVEDEGIVAQDIAQVLAQLGHEVLGVAGTGPEALAKVGATSPELVLMDIRLRGPMDGIDTAAAIRVSHDIPIVFLTAFADVETLLRARTTEPSGYVVKPFDERDLRSAIEVALYKHEMDRKVRDHERWFSTTLRSIGEGVIATDARARVTFLNASAERITGWRQSEALGHEAQEVLPLLDPETRRPIDHPIRRALGQVPAVHLARNALLTTRAGEVHIDESSAPISDAQGKVLGAVVVFRDMTERLQLDEQLAASNRIATMGVLTASIAHELNNPLAYSLANLGVVLEELPPLRTQIGKHIANATGPAWQAISHRLDAVEQTVRDAHEGMGRLKQIVNDLRSFSDPPDRSFSALDLPPLLEAAVRMANNEVRHRARLSQDIYSAPAVFGNGSQLVQIVYHLLVNAAQAINEGADTPHDIRLHLSTDADGFAVIEVKDSGCGIPPEIMLRIFDPFFSTKPAGHGRGLGLAICQTLVQAHGGTLTAESHPGRGSLFRVRLPPGVRPAPEAAAPEKRPLAELHSLGGARVLVVDDEPLVGVALRRTLGPTHQVTVTTSGREALQHLRGGASFDVIFCDLLMPEVSGMDLYEQIRSEHPGQAERAIFLTGGAFTPRSQAFLAAHSDRTVLKPFDPEAIRRLVARQLAHAN